jgi:hypothetical protein
MAVISFHGIYIRRRKVIEQAVTVASLEKFKYGRVDFMNIFIERSGTERNCIMRSVAQC